MIRINIFGILLLFLISCKSEENPNTFSGEFNGYWAETSWHFKFYSNYKFKFKSIGHYGKVESKGEYVRKQDSLFLISVDTNLIRDGVVNSLYLIDGDSCIIDYKLKYDYCKTRKWSTERAIKYPQIKTSDSTVISEIEFMLKDALKSEQLNKQIKDTSKNLIIESYFELDSEYENKLKIFGRPVIFKSQEEIKSYNAKAAGAKDRWIAGALGKPEWTASKAVAQLINRLGLANNLKDAGVTKAQLPLIAEASMTNYFVKNNLVPIKSPDQVMEILEMAWEV